MSEKEDIFNCLHIFHLNGNGKKPKHSRGMPILAICSSPRSLQFSGNWVFRNGTHTSDEHSLFTVSAPRPIEYISQNVNLFLFVCWCHCTWNRMDWRLLFSEFVAKKGQHKTLFFFFFSILFRIGWFLCVWSYFFGFW